MNYNIMLLELTKSIECIITVLAGKLLALIIDETTDASNHSVLNINGIIIVLWYS